MCMAHDGPALSSNRASLRKDQKAAGLGRVARTHGGLALSWNCVFGHDWSAMGLGRAAWNMVDWPCRVVEQDCGRDCTAMEFGPCGHDPWWTGLVVGSSLWTRLDCNEVGPCGMEHGGPAKSWDRVSKRTQLVRPRTLHVVGPYWWPTRARYPPLWHGIRGVAGGRPGTSCAWSSHPFPWCLRARLVYVESLGQLLNLRPIVALKVQRVWSLWVIYITFSSPKPHHDPQ